MYVEFDNLKESAIVPEHICYRTHKVSQVTYFAGNSYPPFLFTCEGENPTDAVAWKNNGGDGDTKFYASPILCDFTCESDDYDYGGMGDDNAPYADPISQADVCF